MNINRNNYEAYLLDLIEGRLSAEDRQKVRDFLLLNPDCAQGIHDVEPWILDKNPIQFPGKEQLKKEIPDSSFKLTEKNFDLFSVARLEGDLNKEQESDHERMAAENKEKGKEWVEWKKTRLIGETILYAQKEQLKRKKGISRRVIWMSVISTAAVMALLFTLLRIDPVDPDLELAHENPSSQPVEEETTGVQAEDPLNNPEETVEVKQEKPLLIADEPLFFSIKKQPDRPIESPKKGEDKSGTNADSVKQVHQERIQPKPLKIAGYVSSYSDQMVKVAYDMIKPLEIPTTSIHLRSLSLAQLADIELQELFDDYTKENNISLWTIANAGFKGINRITGADMSLMASRDDEGDVSGFQFKSRRFSFSRPIGPPE